MLRFEIQLLEYALSLTPSTYSPVSTLVVGRLFKGVASRQCRSICSACLTQPQPYAP